MRWLVLLCVLLTGCTTITEGKPSPSIDADGFLSKISEQVPGAKPKTYLDIGWVTCDNLRSGMTRNEIMSIMTNNGIYYEDAENVISISIEYLCEDMKGR